MLNIPEEYFPFSKYYFSLEWLCFRMQYLKWIERSVFITLLFSQHNWNHNHRDIVCVSNQRKERGRVDAPYVYLDQKDDAQSWIYLFNIKSLFLMMNGHIGYCRPDDMMRIHMSYLHKLSTYMECLTLNQIKPVPYLTLCMFLPRCFQIYADSLVFCEGTITNWTTTVRINRQISALCTETLYCRKTHKSHASFQS